MRVVMILIASFFFAATIRADEPLVVELWPHGAPEETGAIGDEYVRMSPELDRTQVEVTESTRMITNVTRPTISIYRPPKEIETGTAVLICPGGGYWNLYWQLEGEEVAEWLTAHGITGIILKYRVPRRPDEPKTEPARRPLQDAQRAVSLVRSRAKEWGIHPDRIGLIGFSAGGHLAVSTATSFERRTYDAADDIDRVSCRPNFAIGAYSGYFKANESNELAPGIKVPPPQTPPIFLVHGDSDPISTPEHSVTMYLALRKANVPTELHIYASTTHDFGVRTSDDRPYTDWTEACLKWLANQKLLQRTNQHDESTP
jgi:acetyl esterase/lipase